MTSNGQASNDDRNEPSIYALGEVLSEDLDVEVALSPHSPNDNGEIVATIATSNTTPTASTTPVTTDNKEETPRQTWCRKLIKFYNEYDFFILLMIVILLAFAYPPLEATYLQPQVTASWIAVIYIFCKCTYSELFGLRCVVRSSHGKIWRGHSINGMGSELCFSALYFIVHCLHIFTHADSPTTYLFVIVVSGLSLKTEEFKYALKQLKFNIFVQVYGFGFVSAAVFGLSRILIVTNALIVPLANGLVICACLPMAINMVVILSKTSDGDEATAVFNSAFGNMLGVFLSPVLILAYLGISR
jgi:hypothetical protein